MQINENDQNQCIQDSTSKITTKALKDSLSVEERDHQITCQTHGQQTIKQIKLSLSSSWGEGKCPVCEAEIAAKYEEFKKSQESRARITKVQRLINESGIPSRFHTKGFEDYHTDLNQSKNNFDDCLEYAFAFKKRAAIGQNIIMCGTTGTGKTHLACAIAKKIIEDHCCSVVFTSAGRIFREVKSTYSKNSKNTENEAINIFASPDLLIIDEVGVQHGSDSELNILFEIINERYEKLLPTVMISNLAIDKLAAYTGDRVIDRMKENGGMLMVFDWSSHRLNQGNLL